MTLNYFVDFAATENDLPSCAYCGGKLTAEQDGAIWSVGCDDCDITIEPFMTLAHAVIVLSKRYAQPAPPQVDEGEPLPCPFCGEIPNLIRLGTGNGFSYSYHCPNTNCLATNGKFDSLANTIAAWNRRAQPAPPQGELPAPDGLSPGDVAALRMIQRHLKGKYVSGLDILVAKNLLDELLQRQQPRPALDAGGG